MNISAIEFIHKLKWEDIPSDVQHVAGRCVLDLCAAAVAGQATELSRIVCGVAVASYGGEEASLLFDGRKVSAPGAALANGMTIDAMDMHDGYRPAKGHAGPNVFPAALAAAETKKWGGRELLTALVVGYEVALRAGEALHESAADYHTSGAWGALGSAAVTARAIGLNEDQTRHALGIAEYHGPRSPMMRCIDYPTMLKDGSGWGSMTGVMAARLAGEGFTGAPALLVEGEAARTTWSNLGERWLTRELYFKPYACCRWAQPAVDAALKLVNAHSQKVARIARIEVRTFEEATHLTVTRPANTEEAQYSLPYPVAAALVDGRLNPEQVTPPRIYDEEITRLAEKVTMELDKELAARFPKEALAQLTLYTVDGGRFVSDVCGARGDPDDPLSDEELSAKLERIAQRHLSSERVDRLLNACWNLASFDELSGFFDLITTPPER